jgi:redox-sensitive bicupin YhaK (pirin superfamily)
MSILTPDRASRWMKSLCGYDDRRVIVTKTRKIQKIFSSKPTIEGAGVHLRRAFGYSEVPLFDPFLLLDDFRSEKPEQYIKGFPWHPHRGIETITYVLKGDVEHGDSMGNGGDISPGDVQWMTAGSGIVHQEMPKPGEHGVMEGFQLWANLPRSYKMMDPRYRGIKSCDIPEVQLGDGVKVKIICGKVGDQSGAVHEIITDPEYLDVSVAAGTQFTHPTHPDYNVFAYIIDGKGFFSDENDPYSYEAEGINYFDMQRASALGNHTLVLFEKGDQVKVSTHAEPVRFLLFSGRPIGEPVAWYGPIVMNTHDELRTAFQEYHDGTFIKYRRPK